MNEHHESSIEIKISVVWPNSFKESSYFLVMETLKLQVMIKNAINDVLKRNRNSQK